MIMNWSGYWQNGTAYFPGEVVILRNYVYIAREQTTQMPSMISSGCGWVLVGKHEPHKIDHPWLPEKVAYPLPDGTMSDDTLLCSECWITSNYVLAFKADAHEFIIQEMP